MDTKMQIAYELDREMFRSFSVMKDYDGYLIGKLSCIRLGQKSFVNRDGQNMSGRAVKKGLSERKAGKSLDGRNESGMVRVRKEKNNYAVLELQGDQYLLTMTLFRPESFVTDAESNKRMAQKSKQAKGLTVDDVIASRSFAVAEILEFVEAVGDTNGIHRTADPVVPGLLMAEWFFAVLQSATPKGRSMTARVEIRFQMPAYAEQTLCIGKKAEKYICYEENTGQVLWSASVEGVCINQ